MDSITCPVCRDHVSWVRAEELIWDYLPYPHPDLRRLLDVFGNDVTVWACYNCGAFGLSRGLVLHHPFGD